MERKNLFKLKAIRLLMDGNKLSPEQFLEMDNKYDILGYIDAAEEILHLYGDQGVLNELNEYVKVREKTLM